MTYGLYDAQHVMLLRDHQDFVMLHGKSTRYGSLRLIMRSALGLNMGSGADIEFVKESEGMVTALRLRLVLALHSAATGQARPRTSGTRSARR
jgi:hypothetical protein